MSLFNAFNGLEDYRNDPKIAKMLNGCELMNHAEFMEWYLPDDIRYSARIESEYPGSVKRRKVENKEVRNHAMEVLEELATNVCESNIDDEYGQRTMKKLKKASHFDLLVAVDTKKKKVLSSVVAFIIVEKGECSLSLSGSIDRSEVYSVNLICRREEKPNKKSVKGVVLLGAYMYCIKNNENIHVDDKIGILELAGAYTNLSGFFSYTKVGFDKDSSFFGKRCFDDADNLPMSVDINQYSNTDIIQLVSGEKKRDSVKDDTGIYELGLPDKNDETGIQYQMLIAQICSLQHLMNLSYNKVEENEELQTLMDEILSKKKQQTGSKKSSKKSSKNVRIEEEKNAVQDYLDEIKTIYITRIERKKRRTKRGGATSGGIRRRKKLTIKNK